MKFDYLKIFGTVLLTIASALKTAIEYGAEKAIEELDELEEEIKTDDNEKNDLVLPFIQVAREVAAKLVDKDEVAE